MAQSGRIDQATGSGVIIVVGLVGAALIAWGFERTQLRRTLHAGPLRLGPVAVPLDPVIDIGRYLPLAVAAWWLVTLLI